MADSAAVTVATTATLLCTIPQTSGGGGVEVAVESGGPIRVGGSGVAMSGATRGRLVNTGQGYTVDLEPGESLYGIAATGTADVTVLILGAAS